MEPVNTELLDRIAEDCLEEIYMIPDKPFLSFDLKRIKEIEIVKRFMIRYHNEASAEKGIAEHINDVIAAPDWMEETFSTFWNTYDKKVGFQRTRIKWKNLPKKDIKAVLANVEAFVKAHPDKTFRPNPLTYLNGELWNDELPTTVTKSTKTLNVENNTWSYGNK